MEEFSFDALEVWHRTVVVEAETREEAHALLVADDGSGTSSRVRYMDDVEYLGEYDGPQERFELK